jgi:tetratricopeptide (TPR) repeat protein
MAMAAGLSTFGQAVRFIALMETTGILQHNIVPLLRHKDTRFGLAGISARLTSEGNALGDGGQYDRAKEFFELALALNPRNAPAMLSMTIVEVHRGDCRAAASWAEKLQRLRPSEAPEDVVEEALRDLEVKGSLAELRTEAAGWVARCQ